MPWWYTLGLLLFVAGVGAQETCTAFEDNYDYYDDDSYSYLNRDEIPDSVQCSPLTALPTTLQWSNYTISEIDLKLNLRNNAIATIPDGGFDACPYTAATTLYLHNNDITTVGARAFARLAALGALDLSSNAITWMAPTSLDGLPRLGILILYTNRLGKFYYGALRTANFQGQSDFLYLSLQEAPGDLSCNGKDSYGTTPPYVPAAIASCGSAGSPCSGCAVGCPVVDPGPSPGECFPLPAPPADEKLSSGAIGGIVVGAYLGVAAIGGAVAAYRL